MKTSFKQPSDEKKDMKSEKNIVNIAKKMFKKHKKLMDRLNDA